MSNDWVVKCWNCHREFDAAAAVRRAWNSDHDPRCPYCKTVHIGDDLPRGVEEEAERRAA